MFDFTIDDDLGLGEGGQKTKFRNNVEAIKIAKRLMEHERGVGGWQVATPEEQRAMAKYVGWGGLPQAFDPGKSDWANEYRELKALLTKEEYAAARQSTRYAHYTSREIIVDGIYAALRRFGFNGGQVLEGGAGVGNFIGLMPRDMRSSGRVTAVEREPIAATIARALYPLQNVQREDFTSFKGADNYFDAAVGNPPFASDAQVDNSGRKHLSGMSLHNYFFAKEVDMLREGGILAQVVTNSFLDASSDSARRYIADRTKFLGAIRLPNNAFSKNAGTEVTTDLIFLQKRPEKEWGSKQAREDAKAWLAPKPFTDRQGQVVPLNQYFHDHPEMMLGKFGAYGTMYGPNQPALRANPGQDTLALLREAIQRLPQGVYTPATRTASVEDQAIAIKDAPVQEGGFYVDGGKLMQRLPDANGEQRAIELTAETQWTEKLKLGEDGVARIKALFELRTTLRSLLAAELTDAANTEALRKTLNTQYDAFVKAHGLLHDRKTAKVYDDDPDYPLLLSLEHDYTPGMGITAAKRQGIKPYPASVKKSPIFTQRVVDARKAVTKVDDPADALAVSMAERGRLDSGYIGQLLGMDPETVLGELASRDNPVLFLDPASNEYVLRDAYLSGNVRAKLEQAKQAGLSGNVRALEAVQPADVPAHQITARLGSPWIPTKVYEQFAEELYGAGTEVSIRYVAANGGYSVYLTPGSSVANTNTWGTVQMPGDKMLGAVMNNRTIKITFKDAEGNTHTDQQATEDANTKAQEIRSKFEDWLFADADRSAVLVRAYNDTNNNYVTRQYDGSWMRFPGKVPDSLIKFRRHQRNAIARIVQDRTALLDHVVGAGKTFTVISAAMELRRTGLSRKPMIAVPNHLVKQWASDFYRLYPGAKILAATKKDFAKENRRRFLAKIATGDWDAVIVAHTSFGFIKPPRAFEVEFNERQIEQIMATIQQVEDEDGDKSTKRRTIKQLEGIKERLENRIRALRDKPVDNLLDFEQLGVDQLFVDEAHMFKNLMFSTKMQNVQGLGDSKGSQRAYDMYLKSQFIIEKNGRGQGLVFATGTPVSNSLAEKYHMMRYLMPRQMLELGFQSFDAWANTFAAVEQVWMQAASADGYKPSNRMSNFVNVHELLKLFDQVADTVTMDDIKAAYKEENNGKEFPIPPLKGGRRTPVSLDKSQAQIDYMEDIARRARVVEQRRGPPQKGQDNILVIMSDARKAAMDIRLVDPNVTQREPGGRIDRAASEIEQRYRQYASVKGTQLVFSDLGTPIKHAKKELEEYNALKAKIDAATEEVKFRASLGSEEAQAIVDEAEAAEAELQKQGPDWLTAVQAALRGFSVYDDLKAALIERGIPEEEIAFIHDYNTDEQKAALFRKVNAGVIRVLMGSTPKMGAGTNVQERVVAEHHLDVPWRPSDVEQREGRVLRQGNKLLDQVPNFEVEILAYVTRDTLDMRMWQIQEVKLKMINQLRSRQIDRNIENAFEDMEMSAGEMQAAATGNMDLLNEIRMRADIKKLEQQKRSFDSQRHDLEARQRGAEERVKRLPAQVKEAKALAALVEAYKERLSQRDAAWKITIDGTEFTDKKAASAYLLEKIDARVPDTEKPVGADGAPAMKLAPLDVTLNGTQYKSRERLREAFSEARGDTDPIEWELNGQTMNRRSVIENAVAKEVVKALDAEGTTVDLGTIAGLKVQIEASGAQNNTIVDIDFYAEGPDGVKLSGSRGYVRDKMNPSDPARSIVSWISGRLSHAEQEAKWLQMDLEKSTRDLEDMRKLPNAGEWPDQGKLDAARARHRELLKKMNAQTAPAQPEPGLYQVTNDKGEREAQPRMLSADAIKQLLGHGWKIEPVKPDDDAQFARGNPFYSALAREVERIPAKAQGGLGWVMNITGLVKAGKVKADEVEWSGLTDWLRMQQGKVTREQVLEYLAGNGVQVTETVLDKTQAGDERDALLEKRDALEADLARRGFDLRDEYGEAILTRRSDGAQFSYDAGLWMDEEGETVDLPAMVTDIALQLGDTINDIETFDVRDLPVGDAKYGRYQLPGGTNYREVLLTLPAPPGSVVRGREAVFKRWEARIDAASKALERAEIASQGEEYTAAEAQRLRDQAWRNYQAVIKQRDDEAAREAGEVPSFRSGHWDQPNVLAHIRLNDRTDADGKRVLFVEEIQSDWGQQGKKKGFAKPESADFNVEVKLVGSWHPQFPEMRDKWRVTVNGQDRGYIQADTEADARYKATANENNRRDNSDKPPLAPFVTKTDAWVALALKRIIKMAADGGYDRVAFITGEQSAQRYDLSKQVSAIHVGRHADGTYSIGADTKDGPSDLAVKASEDKLADYVGKELAERIIKDQPTDKNPKTYSGLDLKVGGEGMRAFYDQIVPSVLKDVLRKVGGGKLGEVDIGGRRLAGDSFIQLDVVEVSRDEAMNEVDREGSADTLRVAYDGELDDTKIADDVVNFYLSDYDAGDAGEGYINRLENRGVTRFFVEREVKAQPQPGFDITPAMRERAADGLPLFDRKQDQATYNLLRSLSRDQKLDARRVREIVAPIARKWDVEVRVVDTPADLPVKAPADALGLHKDGVIYLVAGTNRSKAQVYRTLAHEAIAHYGLRSMLGRDAFRAFVNQVQFAARARPGPLREVSDYIRRTYVDQDGVFNLTPAQEGDEIAARVVELGVDPISGEFKPGFGMLKAVFSKIAEFLRKLGIPVRFTNAELQGMLVRSMRRLQAGRPLTAAMTAQASMSRAPGFYFDAKSSPLYKQRTAQAAGAISEAQAREALATDAVARRIMAKGIEVQEGDRVGARLNINVLKNTGVAVNTIHRGKAGDGYTKNRGWWGGEVIAYAPVVTLRDAYFNVDQKAREGIAAGAQAKSPMASVDGTFHKAHSFDGVEFRFNPKREHLFRDALGRVLKRADEVTITGNSAYARGEIEYYGPEDVPARAGDAPSQGRLLEPGNDDGDAAFARIGSAQTLSDVTEKLREAVEPIGTVSLWDKTVGTQFNKATKDRDFKRVFDAYLQQTDDTAHYAIEAERNAPDILMRLDNVVDAAKALWHSGPKHKRDLEAVSRALFANIEGQTGVQSVRYDELSLRQIHGLNDRQIAMYYQARAAVDTSIERLAQTYAAQIGAANGLSIDELKNMALDDTVAMVKTHIQETHDGLRADEELRREVMAQDQDEALDRARQLGGFPAAPTVDETRMLLERLDKIEEKARFLQEAGYMPAMRFGEYAVTVTDPETNETLHFEMFESQTAANLAAMRLRREYPDGMIEKSVMNPDQYRMFKGVSPETVELFAQFTGADQSEAYQRYIALAKSARNVKMRELKRKGIAGFSEDATRVLASFVTSNARQAAINMNVDEITAAMASKSLAAKGDVQREAQKLHEYMANPMEEARRLRGFMFMHFLGGSVASALVNLTQPMLQTAPYLSQFAGSRTGAIMARAARMAASGNYDNPALRAAAERAAAEGITEPHEVHQLMADASGSSFGSNLQARAAVKLWGSLFSNAESFNRRITFIAAYQVAMETGQSDPYAFARRAVYETQGIYSKVNRPNWARGGVGATLFTFKQFTISYLEWWRRLPKREKALAFAILVLFAGTEGLPFMDDIEDLIDTIGQTLGYNTNSKKAIRHAMVDTLGKTAGTMLNTGLLSMSGVDVSGRLGLGNLIPGTAMFKPSETDKTRTVSEFAGPLGGLMSQAQRAVAKVQQGNILGRTGALAEIAPSAVRNALQGLEMASTGVYRDTRGYKVSDVTVLESFGKMLGLQPESVASKTRRLSDEIQDKGMVTMMEAMIADRWAAGLAEKDPAKVQAARDALAAWNRNNPETPIRIKPMQITRRVREINRTREERFLRTAPKEMRGAAARELAS